MLGADDTRHVLLAGSCANFSISKGWPTLSDFGIVVTRSLMIKVGYADCRVGCTSLKYVVVLRSRNLNAVFLTDL